MRQLFIKQKVFKITDHYPITDENGNVHYYVDQDFRFIGHTVHVSSPEGNRLFTVDRELFRFLPRYVVHFTNGSSLTLKSNFTLFRRSIDIYSDQFALRLEGDFFDLRFTVYNGPDQIGSIKKAWLSWGDSYELQIYDERFETVFIAIVIAVDRLIEESQNNS